MINKLWAMLFRGTPVPEGDWLRPGTSPYLGPPTTQEITKYLVPDRDIHIRGWLVDACIQLALTSSYRTALLRVDPFNTYAIPLTGEHARFDVSFAEGPGAVIIETLSQGGLKYRHEGVISLTTSTGGYTYDTVGESQASGTLSYSNRTFTGLPFAPGTTLSIITPMDITGTLTGTIVGRMLPAGPAGAILATRFQTLRNRGLTSISPENGLAECAGALLMQMVEGA